MTQVVRERRSADGKADEWCVAMTYGDLIRCGVGPVGEQNAIIIAHALLAMEAKKGAS